uniref:FXYD domain-containing ion transport regulator n=1 Tax=Cynoglossus semilaevis TaxID=244447 RepID=A0A3P8UGI9_CYNSE
MEKLTALTSCLLLMVGGSTAQSGKWATGLIAVAGFLFLSVVGLLVKKAWCEEPKRSGPGFYLCPCHSSTRCVSCICSDKEDQNAFNNLAMDNTFDKVTSM